MVVAVILVEFMSVQQSHGGAVNAEPHPPVMTHGSWGGDQSNYRAKREETSVGLSTNSSSVKPVDKVSSTTAAGGTVSKVNVTEVAVGGGTTKTVKEKTLIIPDRSRHFFNASIFFRVIKNGAWDRIVFFDIIFFKL